MSFTDLLIHKINTYNVGFNGADDYNNPIRTIKKDSSLSDLKCRVQRQITKEKAYSLSEIELLEEAPVNAFIDATWNAENSNYILGITFDGSFSDEAFYLIKTLEAKMATYTVDEEDLELVQGLGASLTNLKQEYDAAFAIAAPRPAQ